MIILGHISGWIGKELIELLSCIYLYIPLLLSWFIILLRNNSLKRGISILSTIGLLLLLVYYTSDLAKEYIIGVESSEYSKAVGMSAAILVFSLCLFRSRSLLLITLLEGILLYFMLPLLKVIIIFDILSFIFHPPFFFNFIITLYLFQHFYLFLQIFNLIEIVL